VTQNPFGEALAKRDEANYHRGFEAGYQAGLAAAVDALNDAPTPTSAAPEPKPEPAKTTPARRSSRKDAQVVKRGYLRISGRPTRMAILEAIDLLGPRASGHDVEELSEVKYDTVMGAVAVMRGKGWLTGKWRDMTVTPAGIRQLDAWRARPTQNSIKQEATDAL